MTKYFMQSITSANTRNGFVFAISLFNVSVIFGLIVIFLMNSVNVQTSIGGQNFGHKAAYWTAISKIGMLEQLIKDYGIETVAAGGVIGNVTFDYIDECHRKVRSEINHGVYKQSIEGMLENVNCDEVSEFPNYSMIYKVEETVRQGRGYDHGWRHQSDDPNPHSWGWRQGRGECEDVWGWNYLFPCEQDTLTDSLVYYNNYGEFLVTGDQGTLDGTLYVGADIVFDYVFTNSIPHIGENENYQTHLKVPESSAVVPTNPIDQNHYTWETVSALDLPDFDHHDYDSLLAIAQTISHDPVLGRFVGDVDWPYDGQWGETDRFHLQNYVNRTLIVNGNCLIKYCKLENIGGSATEPGIIVATGDIIIDDPDVDFIPDNIILIAGGDVSITSANFGSAMDDAYWGSVVNEIHSRGVVTLNGEVGRDRVFSQIYAFGSDNHRMSVEIHSTNFYGLLYAPNLRSMVSLESNQTFMGAMYVNQITNDRLDNNYILLNYRFPTHYFAGGMVGIYQDTENWVLVKGSIREI